MFNQKKANFLAPNPAILAETAFVFSDSPKQVNLSYRRVWQLAAYGQVSRFDGQLHQLEWCYIRSARGTSIEAFYRFKMLLAGVPRDRIEHMMLAAGQEDGSLKDRLKIFA